MSYLDLALESSKRRLEKIKTINHERMDEELRGVIGKGLIECTDELKSNDWDMEQAKKNLEDGNDMKGTEEIAHKSSRTTEITIKVSKITISEECIGCGACLSNAEFFEKAPGGKVKAIGDGTILKDKIEVVNKIIKLCPVSAIQITEKEMSQVQEKEIIKRLHELVDFTYPAPTYKDIDFTDCDTTFDHDARIFSSYEYSSYSAAERAGLSELRSGLFNRMDSIGKHMLHDYEKQVLARLSTYEKSDKNFAYRINKQITEELRKLRKGAEAIKGHSFELPYDFEVIDISPDFSKKTLSSNTFLFRFVDIADTYLPSSMKENVESPDWYSSWINTDEMEIWSGRGTKEKHSYNNSEAILKIKEHYYVGAAVAVKEYMEQQLKGACWQSIYAPIENAVSEKARRLLKEMEENGC